MKQQKSDNGMIGLITMGETCCITAHTYERNDREGIFHTHWNQKI